MIRNYLSCLTGFFMFVMVMFVATAEAQNCWAPVDGGVDTNNYNHVVAMTEYNGSLIVAGVFNMVGGNVPASNIASWNGSTWSALGSGVNTILVGGADLTSVFALAVYNGDLYVAGVFDTAGGIPVNGLAKWDGASWSAVGSPAFKIPGGSIYTMAIYNGGLYVGGYFDSIAGIRTGGIAKWDGTSWSAVAGGLQGYGGEVESLNSYNGKLYVGGLFSQIGGVPAENIAIWNDSTWSAMGTGLKILCRCGGVNAITSNQGNIYAAVRGEDTSSNEEIVLVAGWNGTTWTYVGGNRDSAFSYGEVLALCSYNGNLIAGGYLQNIGTDSVNGIAQWNGTNWSALGTGIGNIYTSGLTCLGSAFGHLIAGGYFFQSGNSSILNIAEYSCTANGINEIASANQVHLYPNPSNGIINVSVDNLPDKSSIQIYNLLGQKLLQSTLNSDKTELNLTAQPTGTYLYRISGPNGEPMGAGTFVVQ